MLTLAFCIALLCSVSPVALGNAEYLREEMLESSIKNNFLNEELLSRKLVLNNEQEVIITNKTIFLENSIELYENSTLTLIGVKLFFINFKTNRMEKAFRQVFNKEHVIAIIINGSSCLNIINSTVYFLDENRTGLIYLSDSSTLKAEKSFFGNLVVLSVSKSKLSFYEVEVEGLIAMQVAKINILNSNINLLNLSGTFDTSFASFKDTYIGSLNFLSVEGTLDLQNITIGRIMFINDTNLFVRGNFVLLNFSKVSWKNSLIKRNYNVLAIFNKSRPEKFYVYVTDRQTNETILNINVTGVDYHFNLTFYDVNVTETNLMLKIVTNSTEKFFNLTFFVKTPISLEEIDYTPPLLSYFCVKKVLDNFKILAACVKFFEKIYMLNSTNAYIEWNSTEKEVSYLIFLDWRLLRKNSSNSYFFYELDDKPYLVEIMAKDSYGNRIPFYFILIIDLIAPRILDVFTVPDPPEPFSNIKIFVNTCDNYPISLKVTLFYKKGNQWLNESGIYVLFDNNCFVYSFILPKFPHNTTLNFFIEVLDGAGNHALSKNYSCTVIDPYFEAYLTLKDSVESLLQSAKFISPKARRLYQMAIEYYEAAKREAKKGNFSLALDYLFEAKKLILKAYKIEENFHKELNFTIKFMLPTILVIHITGIIIFIKIKKHSVNKLHSI